MEKPILTGEKVILRPITVADAAGMFASLADEESMRLTGTQGTFTFGQVEAFCEKISKTDDRADYAITLKDDPESSYIGEVVLNEIDDENRSASFRIAMSGSAYFGKGYGSEATRLIIDYGFSTLNLHRIELEVYDFNPRAQHVYEKCGFVKEGVKRDVLFWDGRYQSAIIMSILEDEWRKRRAEGVYN
ncbi:MAG: RimJ/RimL family protein N-acetyltransferase [Candidatus Promineifilaceae bacterium]|jgi:RimJ/RimL family protein N-acetyltransferase